MTENPAAPAPVSRVQAFLFWLKLGFISFGGPAGQIAIMHQELVERRRWISERRFLHALNYCMVLPGPEAQQLATYIGWLMHRAWGGVVAGVLFVLPSLFILIALSWLYIGAPHRWPCAQKPFALGDCSGRVRGDFCARCAFPTHCAGRGAHRLCRGAFVARTLQGRGRSCGQSKKLWRRSD
jgi:Chromate transporter